MLRKKRAAAGSKGHRDGQRARTAGALFIGRFQPFHKGHEKILGRLLRRHWRVVVAIGSAQEKRTTKNPFSARERKEMIQLVARSHAGWTREIKFVFLDDQASNAAWVKRVRARFSPKRFVVVSANPLVRRLLGKAGYALHAAPLFRRANWMGKRIRKKARSGSRFAALLPVALKRWMEKKGSQILR